MTKSYSFLFLLFCIFVLSGCTPAALSPLITDEEIKLEKKVQKQRVLKERYDEERRLMMVGYPILRTGEPFCTKKAWTVGLITWNIHDFDFTRYGDLAEEMYNLDRGVYVKYVLPGFPAEKAGIKEGAQILAVAGEDIYPGENAHSRFFNRLNRNQDKKTITISIEQDNIEQDFTLEKTSICNYPLKLVQNGREAHAINAYADGKNIGFYRGMMHFINNDDELAAVIAHELAHNIMEHPQKSRLNSYAGYAVGSVLDAAESILFLEKPDQDMRRLLGGMGSLAYSADFETEADYIGAYILHLAGYDLTKTLDFWRRMSAKIDDGSIDFEYTHPINPKRTLLMQKAHEEIIAKEAAGEPLIPELSVREWSKRNLDYAHGNDAFNQ